MTVTLKTKWIGLAAGVALGLALVISLAARPAAAQSDNSEARTISVSGSGEASGQPDIAYVNLGVDISNADISQALNQANTALAAIVSAIEGAGIATDDIQTQNYNVFPQENFDPRTGMATGERVYRVTASVNVTVRDISQAGTVMQAGLNAGANLVNSISFGIADTKALEAEARQRAVADARDKAQQLADAFGVSLGEVVTVVESFGPAVPMPQFDRAMAFAAADVSAPTINPGQLSVSVQVSVTFAIGG